MGQLGNESNPYLYETAKAMLGKYIVVQTAKNIQQGILTSVLPNHIVLAMKDTPVFIRMDEIVWVTLFTIKK